MSIKSNNIWPGSVEKPFFDVSDSNPIRAIHYIRTAKQDSRYDMHFGLELGIILSGGMKRYYGNEVLNLSPGQVWLCGIWEPHGYNISRPPCEAIVLIIYPPALARTHFDRAETVNWLAPFQAPQKDRPKLSKSQRACMLKNGRELAEIADGNSKNKSAWLRIKMMEILLTLQENWAAPPAGDFKSSDAHAKINRAMQIIFESRGFVPVDEAARECSMNRNSLSQLFLEVMGIRFSEFSLRYRLSAAAEQVLTTSRPLKAIAAEYGFVDASHFHRTFCKYYDCSPTEYRKINQT